MATKRFVMLTITAAKLSYLLFGISLICCFANIAAASQSPPAIQLASDFNAERTSDAINVEDFLLSEKLDGVRGYWDGARLLTRKGHIITVPAWFTAGFPDYPLDGELWLGRGQFERMSSLVRQTSPKEEEWRRVRFMVFDLPQAEGSFEQRYQWALTALKGASPYLHVIPQFKLDNTETLYQTLDSLVAQGAEGLMLHRRSATYRVGRNPNLIKLKPYYDAEATVIAHIAGKGQFAGQMGALRVQTVDGRIFSIGSGFNLAQRQHPPAIGTVITYKYLGLTVNGLPRFASFLRVRADMEPGQ